MGLPSSNIVPASGVTAPVIAFINVDFPAPFSPTRAWTSPGINSSDADVTAATPAYDLDTPRTSKSSAAAVIYSITNM